MDINLTATGLLQGFSGKKITPGMAFGLLLVLWSYATGIAVAPFLGWGDYSAEGLLITCSYDFLSEVSQDGGEE